MFTITPTTQQIENLDNWGHIHNEVIALDRQLMLAETAMVVLAESIILRSQSQPTNYKSIGALQVGLHYITNMCIKIKHQAIMAQLNFGDYEIEYAHLDNSINKINDIRRETEELHTRLTRYEVKLSNQPIQL